MHTPKSEDLLKMCLHDTEEVTIDKHAHWHITRVSWGWIYRYENLLHPQQGHSVYVPERPPFSKNG